MANEEHLAILKNGFQAWTEWRFKNPELVPNLIKADLRGADLRRADLGRADLGMADLHGADLRWAILHGANLSGADLRRANLREADLRQADLREADLSKTALAGANLNLAFIDRTILIDVNLGEAKGLEAVVHLGPSTVDIDTIYKSKGKIPEVFLRGCGVPDDMIAFVRSISGKAIEFYSCFISYSSKDEDFANRVHADL